MTASKDNEFVTNLASDISIHHYSQLWIQFFFLSFFVFVLYSFVVTASHSGQNWWLSTLIVNILSYFGNDLRWELIWFLAVLWIVLEAWRWKRKLKTINVNKSIGHSPMKRYSFVPFIRYEGTFLIFIFSSTRQTNIYIDLIATVRFSFSNAMPLQQQQQNWSHELNWKSARVR